MADLSAFPSSFYWLFPFACWFVPWTVWVVCYVMNTVISLKNYFLEKSMALEGWFLDSQLFSPPPYSDALDCSMSFKTSFSSSVLLFLKKIYKMEILSICFLNNLAVKINNSWRTFGNTFIKDVMWVQTLTIIQISILLPVGCKQNRSHPERNYKNKI